MIGFIAAAAFNVTDTYFVARLGTQALAAMGYTFPIVMVIHGLVIGIGIGTASVLSRIIGEGDPGRVRQLTMHALLLGLGLVCLFIAAGYLTLRPILTLMGASEAVLSLAMDYMQIWLAGMLFLVIPMIGNNAIRATGDTLSPSLIMTADLGANIVLDPVFIFGFGPVPAMGIRGAALATVLCRALALVASLYILGRRKRMLTVHHLQLSSILDSWWRILYVGLPAAVSNLLMPITAGIITRIVSGFGTSSVAALSAGVRIEHCVGIPLIAIGASMVPFVGQNWGARAYGRVWKAQRIGYLAALAWGSFCVVMLAALASFIAPLFTQDATVIQPLIVYLSIMPLALAFRGIAMSAAGALNAINRPLDSSACMVLRLVVFQWPLALLGGRLMGFPGVLGGIVIAEMASAPLAALWVRVLCRRMMRRGE